MIAQIPTSGINPISTHVPGLPRSCHRFTLVARDTHIMGMYASTESASRYKEPFHIVSVSKIQNRFAWPFLLTPLCLDFNLSRQDHVCMVRIIAVASQKGGVAKTTSTISIGAELAVAGKSTLLVDMDPQGHLAEGFGLIADELQTSISQVLADDTRLPLADILIDTAPKLHLAPSNIYLADFELEMVSMVRREDRLKHALEPVKDRYDYILIDCPPSLGILTVNAFSAANEVLVPMACEFYALLGVVQLSKSVMKMRRVLNPELAITGILPTRKRNTNHALEVIERAGAEFPGIRIFEPAIPEAVVVTNASAEGRSLVDFAPTSPARLAYQSVTKELCQHAP